MHPSNGKYVDITKNTMSIARHPEFPLAEPLIYLNHAAVGPWPKRTAEAVAGFARENCTFGSRNYPDWLKKEAQLRRQFQQLLNAPSSDDIALVKNTSEALSFVAYGLNWRPGDNIVSSNEEFPSNRVPWQSLASQGVEFRQADLHGQSAPEQALFDLVDRNTRLLTISSIQFATGLRLDLEKIGGFCRRRNIFFCIDAIQSIGAVEFDVQACQADFVMADGHKWLLGPEGLGFFYSTPQAREQLRLTQYGWHMLKDIHDYANQPWEVHPGARRFECGSPNMLGIHALSASLSLLLETGMRSIEQMVLRNANHLKEKIKSSKNLDLLFDNPTQLQSGIVLFKHRKIENKPLLRLLWDSGVICARRGGGIRFSPHFYHDIAELDQAMALLASC